MPLEDTFLVAPEIEKSEQSNLPDSPIDQVNAESVVSDESIGDVENSYVETESVDTVPPVEVINGESTSTILESDGIDTSLSDLFKISREELIKEQLDDVSFKPLLALSKENPVNESSSYLIQEGLLCRQ